MVANTVNPAAERSIRQRSTIKNLDSELFEFDHTGVQEKFTVSTPFVHGEVPDSGRLTGSGLCILARADAGAGVAYATR